MENNEDRCVVNIVSESAALSRPTFIIKVGEKYYATLALWEYDPHAEGLTHEQGKDIAELERLFEMEHQRGPVHTTVELKDIKVICFSASRPPGGHT